MTDFARATEAASQKGHNQFGTLPKWDLSDLYPGKDCPELKADLEKAKADAACVRGGLQGQAR